jgi:hypothetical protein
VSSVGGLPRAGPPLSPSRGSACGPPVADSTTRRSNLLASCCAQRSLSRCCACACALLRLAACDGRWSACRLESGGWRVESGAPGAWSGGATGRRSPQRRCAAAGRPPLLPTGVWRMGLGLGWPLAAWRWVGACAGSRMKAIRWVGACVVGYWAVELSWANHICWV